MDLEERGDQSDLAVDSTDENCDGELSLQFSTIYYSALIIPALIIYYYYCL